MDIESPDTANIYTKNLSIRLTGNPISIKAGYGAPQWAGKMTNSSSGINLFMPAYGYFIHPEWSYTSEPAYHTLRSGTSVLSSGNLEYPTNWSVAAGSYTMDLTSTVYKVGDTSGHTNARWEFDTRRSDPNPPYNTDNLLIITNGNISEEYHRDTT
jgi:hypothetical protein